MIGAILGDLIGSRFEFNNLRSKEFVLLDIEENFMTDDSLMSIAVAQAILESGHNFDILGEYTIKWMRYIGNRYEGGYGRLFRNWLKSSDPKPYQSFGNGSAMRVSACGLYYHNEEDIKRCAKEVTQVTHDHEASITAATVLSLSFFYLRRGMSKYEFKKYVSKYYNVYDTVDNMRSYYTFTEDVRKTMKPAMIAFLESDSFEDAIRNAISIGGDSDTIAAITGSLAEAHYGIPENLYKMIDDYILNDELKGIVNRFVDKVPVTFEKIEI